MAYVSARVRTEIGSAEMDLVQHKAKVNVRTRNPGGPLGEIEIHWGDLMDDSRMQAHLNEEETRELIAKLTAALTALGDADVMNIQAPAPVEDDGETESEPVITGQCDICDHGIHWIACPTGGWWAHDDVHPADYHDASTSVKVQQDMDDHGLWETIGIKRSEEVL
ncbi:hypothetical protein [Nocardia macrotermitis]|uniref:Uncharacterized protein n=1 Tax=Nocardia macrotermitis TaxID=2585198 RepID=A0A7K0DA73_9NOCA|nr:hypothetical protein [Nocardia macrotermitis]MQY22675.1 hypothetical protein [Nocardia macrotermitis]